MSSMNHDQQLDELLSDWAEQSVSTDRLQNLQERILASAREHHPTVAAADAEQTLRALSGTGEGFASGQCVRYDRKPWAAQLAVSVAALLLVAVGVFLATKPRQSATVADIDIPPAFTWLEDDLLQSKAQLLAEMESMFDGQLVWVAEDGRHVELGIDEAAADRAATRTANQRLAVRVVVLRREDKHRNWHVAWAMDVSSRPEELVRIAPRDTDGDALQLWTHELPDGLFAVDCSVQLGNGEFQTQASTLCEDGLPQQIASSTQNGVEYRVFQTVALLDREVG